jgi:phosphoribosylaminoimidazole carboxylase (NCAIR synthetase)
MLNILGQNYLNVEKNWNRLLGIGGIKKYLYGKLSSSDNRKMGHINVIGQNYKDVFEKIKLIKKILNYEY